MADDVREIKETCLSGIRKNFSRNFFYYVAWNPLPVLVLLRGVLAARSRKRWTEAFLYVYLYKYFLGRRGRSATR